MVLQVVKYLTIFHVPSFYNKLHLVDALCTNSHKFWYWSNSLASSIETFLSSR